MDRFKEIYSNSQGLCNNISSSRTTQIDEGSWQQWESVTSPLCHPEAQPFNSPYTSENTHLTKPFLFVGQQLLQMRLSNCFFFSNVTFPLLCLELMLVMSYQHKHSRMSTWLWTLRNKHASCLMLQFPWTPYLPWVCHTVEPQKACLGYIASVNGDFIKALHSNTASSQQHYAHIGTS